MEHVDYDIFPYDLKENYGVTCEKICININAFKHIVIKSKTEVGKIM